MQKVIKTKFVTRSLTLIISVLVLSACSASIHISNSSTTSTSSDSTVRTSPLVNPPKTVSCDSTIKTIVNDFVNGNLSAIQSYYKSLPGNMLSPATGTITPYYAVSNMLRASNQFDMCPYVTTSFVTEEVGLIAGIGTMGYSSALNQFIQHMKSLNASQKQALESLMLSGQPLSKNNQKISKIDVVSNNGLKATVNATFISTSPNVSGSTVNTYRVLKIYGRWYVTELVNVNVGGSSSSSSTPTQPTGNSGQTVPTQVYNSNANVADLYIETGAIPPPGELFYWPTYPSIIQLDNDDWIAGSTSGKAIPWTPTSSGIQATVTEWGSLCGSTPGNSCIHSNGTGLLVASNPQMCNVNASNYSGMSGQIMQARVYASFKFISSTGSTYTFTSPCS